MPNELKHGYRTAVIGFRINAEIKENNTPKAILKDLGEVFVFLAKRYDQIEIEKLLLNHPLANAIIEVLPE